MPSQPIDAPLRKFTLHPSSLTAPTSPIVLAYSSLDPFTPSTLALLRTALLASRTLATERLSIRDSNRRNLGERQAALNRSLEEGTKVKEAERKKKREEDDKREKERIERSASKNSDAATAVAANGIKEEEIERVLNVERLKQQKDANILRVAKENIKVDRVLALVKVNQSEELNGVAAVASNGSKSNRSVDAQGDTKMGSVTSLSSTTSTSVPPASTSSIAESSASHLNGFHHSILLDASTSVSSSASSALPSPIVLDPSSEAEEDLNQPVRRKSSQEKKRKRDRVVLDSDDEVEEEDSSAEPQIVDNPLKKMRKLEHHSSRASAAATPTFGGVPNNLTRSTSIPTITIVEKSPAPAAVDSSKGLSYLRRKLKEDKFSKHSIPTRPPAAGTASSFYVPTNSLVPPQPISIPPIPTPKRQSEVSEDFSKAKPGTQIAFHTFHTWAESFLRPFGEDDLAFLAPRPDDLAPYAMPPFGKYYLEKWDEEDYATALALSTSDAPPPIPPSAHHYASPLEPPPLPRLRPDHLTEEALGMENVFVGPMTERVVAALAFGHEDDRGMSNGFVEDGDGDMMMAKGSTGEDGGAIEVKEKERKSMDAVELEDRIKRELRFIGILGEDDIDWSHRSDDHISSSLRACQRLLYAQTKLNESRKAILTSIVKDRMGYQEYESTRDAQERVIENGWNKRQRGPGSKKKGKKDRDRDKAAAASASSGLGIDANGLEIKAPVSMALISAIQTRDELISKFRDFFEREEEKGRFFGIPQQSVFSDIRDSDDSDGEGEELAEDMAR